MQILSSGSFINLENQEKIEQLIFTAKEIAGAAVGTDGFVNEDENNRRLALEIWQGAEYMCRDHEEANVKNIFINNFLERLREIGGGQANSPSVVSENSAVEIQSGATKENAASKDEFLGFVSTAEVGENAIAESDYVIDADDYQAAEIESFAPNNLTAKLDEESGGAETIEPNVLPQTAAETIEAAEPENENADETPETLENNPPDRTETASNSKPAVGALHLPEKEPYQFDKCTVTATIQLLPVSLDSETRKAVLSVRTHDFAPQISVVELSGAAVLDEILPALEKSFEKYKTDLPVKVMDKLKKEKSAVKKQSSKITVEPKTTAANSNAGSQAKPDKKPVEATISKPENEKTAMTNTAVVKPAENGQQGSLFGF